MPTPVSLTLNRISSGRMPRFDHDGDAALVGKLDGVAGQIHQHLPEPGLIADDLRGQALIDIAGDFEALGLRARGQEFGDILDHRAQREGRASRSMRPASIFERSRISSISDSSVSPDVFTARV